MKRFSIRLTGFFCIALIISGIYQFVIRIDAIAAPIAMFVNMAIGERIPIERVLLYVDWQIFVIPAYLLIGVLLGLLMLIPLFRKNGSVLLLIAAAIYAVCGCLCADTLLHQAIITSEIVPSCGICIGNAMLIACRRKDKSQMRKRT